MLNENYGLDVIAMVADVGQGEDLDAVVEKAYKTGAKKVVVRDLREEFVRDYIVPTVQAGAIYENKYLLGTSIARVISPEAAEFPFFYDPALYQELLPLARILYSRDEERVRDWLGQYWHPGMRVGTLELLQRINSGIYQEFRYRRRLEKGVQTPAETLEKKSGSCRDFAALFIDACRCLDLAARFVSGYMYHSEIDGRMSMHAWAEVYLPGAGWIGFDPSWGILAASQYVPVSVSQHPEKSTPISGVYIGKAQAFLECDVELYVDRHQSDTADKS